MRPARFYPRADAFPRHTRAGLAEPLRELRESLVLFLLSRGRPILRVVIGVAVVVAGLFIFTRILVTVGSLFIVWGVAGEIGRRRRRDPGPEGPGQ